MIPFLAVALSLASLPSVSGDFDHDGKRDTAEVVKAAEGYKLLLRRGAALGKPLTLMSLADPANFYLGTAQSGEFATACGKGFGARGMRCNRPRVTLKGNELAFGFREASDGVAIWKGGRFDLVWLTD
ncbi:hypothetical protein HL653_19165 [Sphingomonas sp. AP4-R1]|uniref:hypothetical protein n=1 Tax=Sphingomonas sp. AP4-R1 TaxID=2735134 RepID=UPI00149348EB|nr:hypothetical protein [Sphingomonas sp. AP4-R1]QJU59591.1 hypothetical protein HL653_19165 [Sphingomonas sp. AP4-R1]